MTSNQTGQTLYLVQTSGISIGDLGIVYTTTNTHSNQPRDCVHNHQTHSNQPRDCVHNHQHTQ